jgi:hypothetical protein
MDEGVHPTEIVWFLISGYATIIEHASLSLGRVARYERGEAVKKSECRISLRRNNAVKRDFAEQNTTLNCAASISSQPRRERM